MLKKHQHLWIGLSAMFLAVVPYSVFADNSGQGPYTPPTGGVVFYLFPSLQCTTDALTCWMHQVFQFSQTAVLLLATVVIVIAGVVYMTSAGNPKQIELSKKLILGALSGVAVIILGKWFLAQVVGVPTTWL